MYKDPVPSSNVEGGEMIDLINTALAKLGSKSRYLKVPEYFPEYESLKGKRIIMVDDSFGPLENILPELVLASDGNAEAILYTDQSLDALTADLMSRNPDILILDYNLSNNLKGVGVANKLKELGFAGKIVGASSESERAKEFIKAGAVGNIDKTCYPTSDAVVELANMTK